MSITSHNGRKTTEDEEGTKWAVRKETGNGEHSELIIDYRPQNYNNSSFGRKSIQKCVEITQIDVRDWFSENQERMRRVQQAWDHHYTEARVAALWPGLTRENGFAAIEVEPFTFCDVTLRPDGIAFMLMHLMSRYATENGHMAEAETKAWFDEQIELADQGRFFFSLTYYRMSAIKL